MGKNKEQKTEKKKNVEKKIIKINKKIIIHNNLNLKL